MDLAIQVLGTAGLVETVVEFTYVVTNRESFTPFEEVFFLTSGSIEMLGEVLFLMVGLYIFLGEKDCNRAKALLRDPVHNCARVAFDEAADTDTAKGFEDDYYRGSAFAIVISVLSLPVWATFWPVWGSLFDGDGDGGLRLALSICSLALCCTLLFLACKGKEDPAVYVVFVMYAMEKVFEVYILLSDLERLCPGDLGKALVAFELTEILSVAYIVPVFVWKDLS